MPFIIGCAYLWILFFKIQLTWQSALLLFLLACTVSGFAILGYFINDFFDSETDRRAAKVNYISRLTPAQQALLLVAALALSLLPWLWLPTDGASWGLLALELFLFLSYSLPVPRIKNIPVLSGLIDAWYAYVNFLLLIYHTYCLYTGRAEQPFIIYFAVGAFFIGFRNILIHQINDIDKDRLSATVTLPQKLGLPNTNILLMVLLCTEIVFMLIAGVLIARIKPVFYVWPIFYAVYIVVRFAQIQKAEAPLRFKQLRHITDMAYQVWFPLLMLLISLKTDWRWSFLIPLHLALLIPSSYLRNFANHVGVPVNYTIYYLFLLFGVNLKTEKSSAFGYIRRRFKRV